MTTTDKIIATALAALLGWGGLVILVVAERTLADRRNTRP